MNGPSGRSRRGVGLVLGLVLVAVGTARADQRIRPIGLDGKPLSIEAPRGGVAAVVFLSAECPIANAYSPTLNAIAAEFPADRLRLVGVFVDPDLDARRLAAHVREYALGFPIGRDPLGRLARSFGASVTPEAFVIDDRGVVRYQGRIDDQFAARGVRNATSDSRELRDAIAVVLQGKAVVAPRVSAVGCPLPEPPAVPQSPTFARDVAPLLQKHCQDCHRPGQVGPFPLLTYEQARKRADDIAAVVEERRMPPWKAVAGYGPGFAHDRSLSTAAIATIAAWAHSGAPEGNPAEAPPPRIFESDWKLGTPDLVLELPEEFAIPAEIRDQEGRPADIYRCFVIPTNLPHDTYISAIEYRPGNPRVVHHILGYVDTTGQAREKDAADPGPGYECFGGPQIEVTNDLSGWAPGADPSILPEGIGRKLPKGADVVLQIHYHPTGKPETDRSRVGLYFAKTPVKQTLHWGAAVNTKFRLKPNTADQVVEAAWEVPVDLQVVAVTPHMHLLGKSMEIWAERPDGNRQDLIRIDDWDFRWQIQYQFRELVDLPAKTVVKLRAVFDNSSGNPNNPDPNREVTWGEATTDEMCIGFLAVVKKGQDLTRPGEPDDLAELLRKQLDEIREQRRKAANERRRQEAPRREDP